jgi:hypothetical protein
MRLLAAIEPGFSISQRALACPLIPQQIFLNRQDSQVFSLSKKSTVKSMPCAIITLSNRNSGLNVARAIAMKRGQQLWYKIERVDMWLR